MSIEKEKKPAKAPARPKKAAAADASAGEKAPKAATPAKTVAAKAVAPAKTAAVKAVAPAKKTAAKTAAKAETTVVETAAKSATAAGVPEAVAPAARLKQYPTHSEIADRAYGYFLERHGQHGYHEQDWFRAERELLGNA